MTWSEGLVVRVVGSLLVGCSLLLAPSLALAEPPGGVKSGTGIGTPERGLQATPASGKGASDAAPAPEAAVAASHTRGTSRPRVIQTADALVPEVATDGGHATGPTTAVVDGNVDPNGHVARVRAEFALASSRWCMTAGIEGARARTAPQRLPAVNAVISELAVKLEDLEPGREYCAEFMAANAFGRARGAQIVFSTPSLSTQPVSSTHVTPPAPSSSTGSGGWPTEALVAVSGLTVLALGSLMLLVRSRSRPQRPRDARPASS